MDQDIYLEHEGQRYCPYCGRDEGKPHLPTCVSKFNVNKAPYDENKSRSALNIHNNRSFSEHPVYIYHFTIRKAYGNANEWPTIRIFRHCFGRAAVVKQYTLKNHIWTFSNAKAVLYCLISTEGVSFEYNAEISDGKEVLALISELTQVIKDKAT